MLCIFSVLSGSDALFVKDGKLTEPLIELLKLDGLYAEGDGLAEAVAKTQENWVGVFLGRGGKERVDLVDPPKWVAIRSQVIACAEKLGISQAKMPSRMKYDYAFFYGGFLSRMRLRLNEILAAWERGVRFDELVVLTSDRSLRLGAGQPDDLGDLVQTFFPQTEADAARLLVEQTALPSSVRINFNCAYGSKEKRPSRGDTIQAWLFKSPKPGMILAPSLPLFYVLEDLVAKNILTEGFLIDSTGGVFVPKGENVVSLLFDTVAKSLFEIKIKYSKQLD